MRPAARMPKLTRRSRTLIAIALTVIGLLLIGPRLIDAYVDWLWFGELGYRSVFTTVLMTRLIVFVVIGLLLGPIGEHGLAEKARAPVARWFLLVCFAAVTTLGGTVSGRYSAIGSSLR